MGTRVKFLTINGKLQKDANNKLITVTGTIPTTDAKLLSLNGNILKNSDNALIKIAPQGNLTSPFYKLSATPDISSERTIAEDDGAYFGAITCVYKDGTNKKLAGYEHNAISVSSNGYVLWMAGQIPDFLWIYNSTVYDALMAQFAQMGFTIDSSDVTTKAGYFYPEMIGETTAKMHNAEKVYYRLINDYELTDITGLSAWINNSTAEVVNNFVIDNDIVEINRAFYYGSNLTSITIPDSVTGIGDQAFRYCTGLTSVLLGNSVTSISSQTFEGCNSLTSITIPDSVTSIGSSAFDDCENLTDIYINKYKNAISGAPWGAINATVHWGAAGLYDANGSLLVSWENSGINNTCSNAATVIANYPTCTMVDIKDTITTIASLAFSGCSNLVRINVPSSVTTIGDNAFAGCTALTDIYIDKLEGTITGAPWGAPDTVTVNWIVFGLYDANGILLATYLTSGLIADADYTEDNFRTEPGSGYSTMQRYPACTKIILPNTITKIGDCAFRGCSSLTNITIPDSVTSIGERAFWNCSSLTNITIPDSVTSIGDYAFEYCSSLQYNTYDNAKYLGNSNNPYVALIEATSISITSCTINSNTKFIMGFAFWNCNSLTSITIPDSVISIGEDAFFQCSGLTSITIPDSVTSIGYGAFRSCSGLTSMAVDNNNQYYYSEDNCIIEKSAKKLVSGCKTSVIPNDVIIIGDYAFYDMIIDDIYSTSITIPDSVTSIGERAFFQCSGLTSVTIGNSVTSIGYQAFQSCASLTSITIPDSVTSIGKWAFQNCSGLTSITVGSNNIKYYSTDNCLIEKESKTLVLGCNNSIIPNDVTSIGEWAFSSYSSLTSITIPDSVTSIGESAFNYCMNLTSITYNGTKAQWNAITKGTNWDSGTGNYTVHCTDGDIPKSA